MRKATSLSLLLGVHTTDMNLFSTFFAFAFARCGYTLTPCFSIWLAARVSFKLNERLVVKGKHGQ